MDSSHWLALAGLVPHRINHKNKNKSKTRDEYKFQSPRMTVQDVARKMFDAGHTTFSNLIMRKHFGISEDTARRRIHALIRVNLAFKVENGKYRLITKNVKALGVSYGAEN